MLASINELVNPNKWGEGVRWLFGVSLACITIIFVSGEYKQSIDSKLANHDTSLAQFQSWIDLQNKFNNDAKEKMDYVDKITSGIKDSITEHTSELRDFSNHLSSLDSQMQVNTAILQRVEKKVDDDSDNTGKLSESILKLQETLLMGNGHQR